MAPRFGTSGLRGLVTELTPDCIGAHIAGFAASCPMGTGLYVGHDLRASSPGLAGHVIAAARTAGLVVTHCGAVPTPALALAAMKAGAAAVMVTGSHIPADRNGLKFYTPDGEITKTEEAAILTALGHPFADTPKQEVTDRKDVTAHYMARYSTAFQDSLAGMRIGLYAHSAVGRDSLFALLQSLGAQMVELGRSDTFIPVDTEAVSDGLRAQLRDWARTHALDAIVSTDADGDRPLLADAHGEVIPGDMLGQITAQGLGATHVVTPVSSNSGVVVSGRFVRVMQTRIGSPFVIAGMAEMTGQTVGYEANGGFILGFDAQGPCGPIPALMTRDAVLPLLTVLGMAAQTGLRGLVAAQPDCVTASDRLQDIDTVKARRILASLAQKPQARAAFLQVFDAQSATVDLTDGVRMTFADGRIVHVRLSGNAPELRVYAEAGNDATAKALLRAGLAEMQRQLS